MKKTAQEYAKLTIILYLSQKQPTWTVWVALLSFLFHKWQWIPIYDGNKSGDCFGINSGCTPLPSFFFPRVVVDSYSEGLPFMHWPCLTLHSLQELERNHIIKKWHSCWPKASSELRVTWCNSTFFRKLQDTVFVLFTILFLEAGMVSSIF